MFLRKIFRVIVVAAIVGAFVALVGCSDKTAEETARDVEAVRNCVYDMGVPPEIAPFMNMSFVSLPVIPHLKLTTLGLVDVDRFEMVPLFV